MFQQGFLSSGSGRRPVVTWTLMAVIGIVWLAAEVRGGSERPDVLLDFGAMFGPLVANGEYWRLFTAMFLHVGVWHLVFNGLGLLIFGQMVERIFGRVRFAIIYVAAGLFGGVASYLFNPIAIGAGASGAIFGVLGALAAFFVARRHETGEIGRQYLTMIAVLAGINLFYGFATPGIDNWAHIGGFVGGFGVGMAFVPQFRSVLGPYGVSYRLAPGSAVLRWWVLPVAGALLFAGVWLGTATLEENPITHIHNAERLIDDGEYEEALSEISAAIAQNPIIGRAYFLRAAVYNALGDKPRATSQLRRAFQLGLDEDTRREATALLIDLGFRP